jgi:hypothetical protein
MKSSHKSPLLANIDILNITFLVGYLPVVQNCVKTHDSMLIKILKIRVNT